MPTDVAEPADWQGLVDETVQELGRVDVLVNNAGIGTAVPATRETVEQFRSVIDVNLNGCYWMAQAGGRVMQPGSAAVATSDRRRAAAANELVARRRSSDRLPCA